MFFNKKNIFFNIFFLKNIFNSTHRINFLYIYITCGWISQQKEGIWIKFTYSLDTHTDLFKTYQRIKIAKGARITCNDGSVGLFLRNIYVT